MQHYPICRASKITVISKIILFIIRFHHAQYSPTKNILQQDMQVFFQEIDACWVGGMSVTSDNINFICHFNPLLQVCHTSSLYVLTLYKSIGI